MPLRAAPPAQAHQQGLQGLEPQEEKELSAVQGKASELTSRDTRLFYYMKRKIYGVKSSFLIALVYTAKDFYKISAQ